MKQLIVVFNGSCKNIRMHFSKKKKCVIQYMYADLHCKDYIVRYVLRIDMYIHLYNLHNDNHDQMSNTVKHLLFTWPYFREATTKVIAIWHILIYN